MPTNYKWYPGHYILGAGDTKDLVTLLNGIAGTGTNNIKNIRGVQMRYVWKQHESATVPGAYDFTKILNDLQTLKDYSATCGRLLSMRILLQFKGIGGRGAPEYLWKTTNPGYDPSFGIGVYTWGNAASDSAINEHPALWIPAVEDRLTKFMQALGAALDSIGKPSGDIRYHLSTVDFNETSWGKNGDTALTSDQQTKQKDALLRIQLKTKAAFPTTIVGHFVNFPAFAVNNMVGPMRDNGITLGGPDTWWDDPSVENGVYQQYEDAWGVTAISPSVQNQNWEFKKHADVNPPIYYIGHLLDASGNPTLQKIYDRVTDKGVTVDGVFRKGLKGTHITWQGATWALHKSDGTLSTLKPWNLIRDFFRNKWDSGPDAGNPTPGVVTAIPSKLDSGTAPPPPPPPPSGTLALVLTNDTGAVNNDKVTSNAAVDITGITAGATKQYSTSSTGPWSNTPPTPIDGSNTWYGRQVVSGSPSAATPALTFSFCDSPPVLSQATVDGTVLLLTYDSPLTLTNATGFKPLGASFSVKSGATTVAISGTFVNEGLKRVRIDLATAVAVGATITVSYTQPTSGTARTQDLAGNYAANLVNQAVVNLTGVAAPTTTVTITAVGGAAMDGSTSDATPTVTGTLSATLSGTEQLELQRAVSGGTFNAAGYGTVTSTSWSLTEPAPLAEGTYQYRARVRNGELLGTFSTTFNVTVDTTPPDPPTSGSVTVPAGVAAEILGSWSNGAGETLSVAVGDTAYTTANGLVISGTNWSLTLPVMPPGTYFISALTTDAAGNTAVDDTPGVLTVTAQKTINHARLAMARRRS